METGSLCVHKSIAETLFC